MTSRCANALLLPTRDPRSAPLRCESAAAARAAEGVLDDPQEVIGHAGGVVPVVGRANATVVARFLDGHLRLVTRYTIQPERFVVKARHAVFGANRLTRVEHVHAMLDPSNPRFAAHVLASSVDDHREYPRNDDRPNHSCCQPADDSRAHGDGLGSGFLTFMSSGRWLWAGVGA